MIRSVPAMPLPGHRSSATAIGGSSSCSRDPSRAARCRRACSLPVPPASGSARRRSPSRRRSTACASSGATPVPVDAGARRRVRHCAGVHAHRPRRAPRRPRRRAGRQRLDQDRAGARRHRSRGVPAVRRAPARRHHRRGRRAGGAGAERAAEDARGAAALVGVHPGDGASRHAAADGAVAVSAAARSAVGASARLDGATPRPRDGRAAASLGAASAAGARDAARARLEGARRILLGARHRRGEAPAASDREQLATHLRAMASLLRDVELLADAARTTARWPTPTCSPALERLTTAYRRRARRRARSRRSIARWRRSSATPASRSWPTGWCCSCERPAAVDVPARLRRSSTPVGRRADLPARRTCRPTCAPRPGDRGRRADRRRARRSARSCARSRSSTRSGGRRRRLAAARRPRRDARRHRRAAEAPAARAGGVSHRAAEDPRARARHEAGAGRAGVRRLAADLLLHGRRPRRFPRAGARAGRRVPDAHRDAADRRARRSEDDRRLRHVRPAAVLHDVPARRSSRCRSRWRSSRT